MDLFDDIRPAPSTFLYELPKSARLNILLYLGMKNACVIPCINRDHEGILMEEGVFKAIALQRWNLSQTLLTSINNEKKMKWFDFGIIMLSLIDELERDMFAGCALPESYEDLWVEARLGDFFCHQDNVFSRLGFNFQFLIGEGHFERILQNALAPQTVHDDAAYNSPDFKQQIHFFGHHLSGKESTFLGFYVPQEDVKYDSECGLRRKMTHFPIVEWCYWSGRIEIVYLNFDHFLAMGGQPSYMAPATVDHTLNLQTWLKNRQLSAPRYKHQNPTSLQKAEDDMQHVSLIEKQFPRRIWQTKLRAILRKAVSVATPQILTALSNKELNNTNKPTTTMMLQ